MAEAAQRREDQPRNNLAANDNELDLRNTSQGRADIAAGKVGKRRTQIERRAGSPYAGGETNQTPRSKESKALQERAEQGRTSPNETQVRGAMLRRRVEANPERAQGIIRQAIRDTFEEIDAEFHKKGEKFNVEDVDKIKQTVPPLPPFPTIMVSIAVLKDLTDFPSDATLVGIFLATFLGIVVSLILTIWSWKKMGGWWWKKYIISWFWKAFVFEVLIEIFPFLQLIPATTILVLMTHYRELKVVKLLNLALDKMHDAGIMKYI